MTQQELSAQEASINKAIGFLEKAEAVEAMEGDLYALIDAGKGWAMVSQAITLHNNSVVTGALAEAAVSFVKSPAPEAYAALGVAVDQYLEER